ncbi:MAG: DUF554 domain-containing protein [Candidatus Wallacebacter cryptica]
MFWGTIINALAIALGSVIGMVLHLQEATQRTIMHGLGLVVMIIGIKMGLDHDNILIPLASIVAGGFIGEILKIEARLEKIGDRLGKGKSVGEASRITQGFVTASLVYCVGAMAVIGALESGLHKTHETLLAKAMLDGVSAVFFASSFGIGVLFSAVPVFIYQSLITVFAGLLEPLFHAAALQAMGATGGLLIVGIGLNILGVSRIAVGNLLPSLAVAVILSIFF